MAKTQRYFLSDIHLSSQNLYDGGYAWFKKPKHQTRLINFIDQYILGNSKVKDVILLGDIFDTWVCPADTKPPTYDEIFDANREILTKFNEITANGIELFYVNGNHDYDLTQSEIKKVIPKAHLIKKYSTSLLRAEHGNRFDEIFNNPDYFCDPAFGLPIGYIMSRLVASITTTGYSLFDLPTYLDDIVEAAGTDQNIFESIIEGLAERAGLGESGGIVMPNGSKLTIENAKARYKKLEQKYSFSDFIRELWDRSSLGWQADRMCIKEDLKIVVFGHSHKATIDKDFFLTKDRIYANTGSWCLENAYSVMVEKGKSFKVTLLKIDPEGKVVQKTSETV